MMKPLMKKLFPCPADYPETRLFSLDVLRGLDMLLLTVVGPLLVAAQKSWACFPDAFMGQLKHGWVCFTLWDIIMPLFIFMSGAAIPFALGRRLKEGKGVFWRHVLARVALLWFLGGLVQGNWMTLDPVQVSPFSNTLQSIAVGYLIVAATMALGRRGAMIAVPIVCAAVYTIVLAVDGDYSKFGNAAYKIDHAVLKALLPETSRWVTNPSHYTWFLSSLMFAVMAFAGYHATRILQSRETPWRRVGTLFAYGAALLTLGLVSEIWIPCIKPIYTLSFTAQAMGWCVLALVALHVVNDLWKIRCGFSFVLLFGQMALTAYFVSHFFHSVLAAFAHLMGDGILSWLPASASAFGQALFSVIGLVAAMLVWRSAKARFMV